MGGRAAADRLKLIVALGAAATFSPVAFSLTQLSEDIVDTAGYPGLAGLILVENIVPPIPSEVILPLAGVAVERGQFTFVLAVLAATLGSVLGALLIYALARSGGRPLLLRHGRVLRLSERDLDRGDEWFDRHGAWVVLGGRLVPGVRSLVSVPAGLSEMPVLRFAALTALGSAVWNSALIGAGWGLGENADVIGEAIGGASRVVLIVVVAAAVTLIVWLRRRRRPA